MAEDVIVTRSSYFWNGSFVTNSINTIIGVIELFLLARLVLELLGANSASTFVGWVYSVSGAFLGPFVGAFPSIYLTQNSMLDIVAIFGMVGYALLGWLIIELIAFVFNTARRI